MTEDDYCAVADDLEARGCSYLTVAGRTGWYRDGQFLGRTVGAAVQTIRSETTEDAS